MDRMTAGKLAELQKNKKANGTVEGKATADGGGGGVMRDMKTSGRHGMERRVD